MPLHLRIENETSLPDGGPIAITVTSKRGIDIGRDQYLDWVLPDPTRFISGKHCEVRFKDGKYWLTDVSTNGTFVNRSEFRIDRPHALQDGDRIEIGRFIIAVALEPEAAEAAGYGGGAAAGGASQSGLWDTTGDVAPAINPRELRTPSVAAGVNSLDMLDWAADIPMANVIQQPVARQPDIATPPAAAADFDDADWITPQPRAELPRPARPVETPAAAAPPAAAPLSNAWDFDADPAPVPSPARPAAAPERAAAPLPPQPVAPPPMAAEVPPLPEMPAVAPVSLMAQPAIAPTPAPMAPPPPQPASPPSAAAPAMRAGAPIGSGEFLRRFAKGAGLPEDAIAMRDEGQLAEMLGAIVRNVAENLRQLNTARAQSKGMMRSSNQTMLQATENNPLRFSPTAEDALRIMFGPPSRSYLDAYRALEQSFSDLKKHQVLVFSAMQSAVSGLASEIDPKRIEAAVDPDKGVGALLASRKSRLWDHYVTVWQAKAGKHEQGMLGVYMLMFADAYDKSS